MCDSRDCLPGFAYSLRRLAADAAHRLALYFPPFGEIGERAGATHGGGPQASDVEDDRAGVIPDILFGYATARLRAGHLVDVDPQLPRQPANRRRGGDEFARLPGFGRFLRLRLNASSRFDYFASRLFFFLGFLFAPWRGLLLRRLALWLLYARFGPRFRPRRPRWRGHGLDFFFLGFNRLSHFLFGFGGRLGFSLLRSGRASAFFKDQAHLAHLDRLGLFHADLFNAT